MDPRTLISYSLLLCVIGDIGVRSSGDASLGSLDPTLPTIFAAQILDNEDSKTRHSNRFKRVPNGLHERSNEREDDVEGAPPDHVVPFSPHEDPEEPPTKPRYTRPGEWAKPSHGDIPLDFVPTKLYAQVRETHTVKRLPREEALKSAETAEEILAAPRLREVVSKSKSNTVYTEEGYEDAAYDHAGHVREADFHEGYASKLDDERSTKKGQKTGTKESEKEDVKPDESDSAEELNDYDDEYRKHAEGSSRIEETSPKRRNESDEYERLKSQIDHAGHVREADFHDELDDERSTKKGGRTGVKESDKEDVKPYKSDSAEELNDYDDEYRKHAEESSRIEEASPKRGNESDEYEMLKSQLKNGNSDPKQVTENGIEKLEEDLNREYEEAERDAEKEVPENLKNAESDREGAEEEEDDDDGETASDDGGKHSEDTGRRRGKEIDEPKASSRAMLVDGSGEILESQNNDIRRVSSSPETNDDPPSQRSAGFAESDDSERRAGELATTPDYGKLFWDYYKTDANIWKTHVTSAPNVVTSATNEADKSVIGSLTSVPSFPSVETGIGVYDAFAFTPPSTALSSLAFATRTDSEYPSATSFYESWKRRDRNPGNRESFDHGNFESASNTHPIGSDETAETDSDSALNLRHGQSATTLIGPKKLSYTVIIRPGDKATTRSPPCDHENHSRPEETNFDEERTNPGYTSVASQFEGEIGPETMNGFDPPGQDLTVIRPPLPVPLGQIAFADFPSDPYGSLVQPSVNQESGHWQLGQEINGERDGYVVSENPDDYRLQNHVGHASKVPRVRHHRGPPGRKRNHYYPLLTKLVPPSPASRSKYAEYSGVRRNSKPKTRNEPSSRVGIWPELLKFYRMMDGSIFGRRRRRSLDETTTKGTVSNGHEKVDNVAASSRENHLWHERNLFREETNRLVAASPGDLDLPRGDNLRRGKSSGTERRKRRSGEDLFDETPRIAEEVINAEIESRFEDDDDHEESSNNDDDTSENERAKIEVEVPDFNFTEVIDSNERYKDSDKRHKAMETGPREAERLDLEKYPFYANSQVSQSSALKYITNPRQVPRKTLGGTEFYDSRDRYLECADVEPDLERVTPEEDEPDPDREPRGDRTRLRGLGDKLDCFRAKYFDEDPLDNPLFIEKNVGEPRVPDELDPAKFASRIIGIASDEVEERVARRFSRKPEVRDLRRGGSNQVSRQADKQDRERVDDDGSSGPSRSRYKTHGEGHQERGRRRRPMQTTTESPELPVTPYQREVYEDVMGTIKNLAGMYQTFGESVQTQSIQPNVNHLPAVPEESDWAFPVVHITQRPRGFMIRGMPPPRPSEPQTRHRYRIFPYRTNKVSYGTRPRTKPVQGTEGVKVGYFKTVRVHKRSLDDRVLDSYAEESRSVAVNSTHNASEPAGSEKTIYTIRDRIRHSRPRGEFGRNGKFTNLEAAGTEDVRRREPRYDRVRRKKVPSSTSEPATTSYREEIGAANSEQTTVSSPKKPVVAQATPREDFLDEPGELYKIQYSTPQRRQAHPGAGRRAQEPLSSEDHEKESGEATTQEARSNNYDVRENVDEDVVTPVPAIVELQKYLESEPPGYSEAFDGESTEPPGRYAEEGEKPGNSQSAENDEEDEERDERVERPSESYVEEESSPDSEEAEEKPDAPGQSESYRNSDGDDDGEENEGEEEGKEESPGDDQSSHVEDGEKEFMRFASRPFSPFESNEDPKYSDLGPRLAKPSFHHPSFSTQSYSKHRTGGSGGRKHSGEDDDDSGEEENSEKQSRYVFPWEEDEAEGEESEESRRSRPIERYEYPWERRERLARERRRKRKEREKYEKLFRFSDSSVEDEEQDASHSELFRRRVYPWERYEVPTKSFRRTKASLSGKAADNDEMGTENRPVRRFSSRYKSRRLHPNDDEDPIAASGADPKEIRVSILKSIETASKEKGKSSEADKTSNATTAAIPKSSTDSPINHTTLSSNHKIPSTNHTIPSTNHAIPSTNHTIPSINRATPLINRMTPLINRSIASINRSIASINRTTASINRTTPSINRSTTSINRSTPLINPTTPSINPTTPSINPTTPLRRSRNWKSRSTASPTSTTTPPTSTTGKPRIWRVASSTTKKPLRSRNRTTTVASSELPKSGRDDLNASASVSSTTIASAIDRRNARRRGQSSNRSSSTPTTARRRLQTSTKAPEEAEASTLKTVTERTTTPIGKTIEHRSRFSKEEIITKTSYPRINLEDVNNDEKDKNNGRANGDKDSPVSDKIGKVPMNERVEKVSIVTKETPEHIYRKEEIDKDGVKGMFVSITPNNGTNSQPESKINEEDKKEMLRRFANSEDEVVQDGGEDVGGSFVQDSYLLGNLLRQVPPYANDLTLDENVREGTFSGEEGSGSVDTEDDADEAEHFFRSHHVKHPHHRLYYYVEKRKR